MIILDVLSSIIRNVLEDHGISPQEIEAVQVKLPPELYIRALKQLEIQSVHQQGNPKLGVVVVNGITFRV